MRLPLALLSCLSVSAAQAAQEPRLRARADDPLHLVAELLVGPGGAALEHVAEHSGALSVWASSAESDPRLAVEVVGRAELLEDDDSGGGTTAWLSAAVAPGDVLSIAVRADPDGVSAAVELHVVAVHEGEAARAAAAGAEDELAALRRLQGAGRLEEAAARARALVEALAAGPGAGTSARVSGALYGAGLAALELASPRAAAEAFAQVLAFQRRRLPPDHPDVQKAKTNLSLALFDAGDLDGALALGEEVLAAYGRTLPPDHPHLLDAKQALALTRGKVGDLAGERELEEEVLAARERLLPPDHPELLAIKENLALTLVSLREPERALGLEQEVLAARERLLPPDHPKVLASRINLASVLQALGDARGALVLEEQVVEAFARLLPPDDPSLLVGKQNLALSRKQTGDLRGALELELEVVAARQRLLPPGHPDLLEAKVNLAATRHSLGELREALALEEEVLAVWEELLPEDHPDLLAAQRLAATTMRALGDLAGARALEERALAALERTLPPDGPDLLAVKQNLALTLKTQGDLRGARALEEEVLAARRRTLAPDHPDVLDAELNLAGTLHALGELAAAEDLSERVLEARRRRLPADHPRLLLTLQQVALVRKALGDTEGARALEEEVLAGCERVLPPDHPRLLAARLKLAATRYALGDVAGARELATGILLSLAGASPRAVLAPPREAREAAAAARVLLEDARFAADLEGPELARAAFAVTESYRHAVTAPHFSRAAEVAGEEADAARAELARAEAELDALVARGLAAEGPGAAAGADPGRAWREDVQAAALRRDRALRRLLALVDEDLVVRVTPEAVAAALPAGHVAVGITRLQRWRWSAERTRALSEGPRYLAFVVTPGAAPREVDLGPAGAIEEKIRAWRQALGAGLDRRAAAGERGWAESGAQRGLAAAGAEATDDAETGRALRRALVDPLLDAAGRPAPGTTLHLCLDDALLTVPVDALPLDATAGEAGEAPGGDGVARVGDRYRVRCELSMARLIRADPDPGSAPSLLAVGDVDFDARPGGAAPGAAPELRSSGSVRWEPLSGTAAEVSALAERAERELGVEALVLRGDRVTQAGLAAAARGRRYLHLATHGWFLPRGERGSMLDDEPRDGRQLGARATAADFTPLLLCGLVLSGANAAGDAEGSAGLLTAEELAGFDLAACDLAVLSACETNVGIARAGRGIQSLQTALHMAGARTSVTSLWAVRDWPTQELMERFYENLWAKGLTKAEALWEAKCALRRAGQPPYAWAGWVLTGDPE